LILIQIIDINFFHENQALGIHCKCTLAEPCEHIMHSIKFEPTSPRQKSYKSKQLYVRKTLNDMILNSMICGPSKWRNLLKWKIMLPFPNFSTSLIKTRLVLSLHDFRKCRRSWLEFQYFLLTWRLWFKVWHFIN
jgi:hypothetical protein